MNQRHDGRNVVSPFDGSPRTIAWTDAQGNPGVTVHIRELTPQRAKVANALSALTTLGLFGLTVYGLGIHDVHDGVAWVVGLALPIVLNRLFMLIFHALLAKHTEVVLTPKWLHVTRSLTRKTYDRALTHRFLMLKHDKAREERERQQRGAMRARANGQVTAYRRYYDDSYHIVFEYMGYRIDVADVFGMVRATAVNARLKACDKLMDTMLQAAGGDALNPADQWNDAPGKVPGA